MYIIIIIQIDLKKKTSLHNIHRVYTYILPTSKKQIHLFMRYLIDQVLKKTLINILSLFYQDHYVLTLCIVDYMLWDHFNEFHLFGIMWFKNQYPLYQNICYIHLYIYTYLYIQPFYTLYPHLTLNVKAHI